MCICHCWMTSACIMCSHWNSHCSYSKSLPSVWAYNCSWVTVWFAALSYFRATCYLMKTSFLYPCWKLTSLLSSDDSLGHALDNGMSLCPHSNTPRVCLIATITDNSWRHELCETYLRQVSFIMIALNTNFNPKLFYEELRTLSFLG